MLSTYVLAVAALVSLVHAVAVPDADAWTNHNYLKSIDLSGSSVFATTSVSIRPKDASTTPYYFYLSAREDALLSWARVTAKPGLEAAVTSTAAYKPALRSVLHLEQLGPLDGDEDTVVYSIRVPADLIGTDGLTLTLDTLLNHATTPLPETVKQTEPQLLLWRGDAVVRSPYMTMSARIKLKSPSPNIVSLSPASSGSKSGANVLFGPYTGVAPYNGSGDIQQGSVHFQSDAPQVTAITLDRVAEISHWGDALSIEDRILLRNTGPALKGHFSRIEHQMSSFYKKGASAPSNALTSLKLFLPAGARDAYFIDQIGNVSTSRFRPSVPNPALVDQLAHSGANTLSQLSLLELVPRFPLLGGWNYTFSVGFNVPLSAGGWLKSVSGREFVAAIPFFTPMKDVAVDTVRTTIVLPELANNVRMELPFAVDNSHHTISQTYLDTHGRPTITLTKHNCAHNHGRLIYVRYTLPLAAHYRKVASVFLLTLALFSAAAIVQRLDTKIK